ncbi:MAG: hypothetical protein PHR44_02955 [Candidatus Omnitrophica bacterium]|nr:hypothetical protein [Candidatus Omnitrophota bacterium]
MGELDSEIEWEWHWERFNRAFYVTVHWSVWVTRFLLLALATYQFNLGKEATWHTWFVVSMVALSTFNIALPLLNAILRFQQRQEVHDRNAREYSIIKTEFLAGVITLNEAVVRFKEIRRKPTELTVRQTP